MPEHRTSQTRFSTFSRRAVRCWIGLKAAFCDAWISFCTAFLHLGTTFPCFAMHFLHFFMLCHAFPSLFHALPWISFTFWCFAMNFLDFSCFAMNFLHFFVLCDEFPWLFMLCHAISCFFAALPSIFSLCGSHVAWETIMAHPVCHPNWLYAPICFNFPWLYPTCHTRRASRWSLWSSTH